MKKVVLIFIGFICFILPFVSWGYSIVKLVQFNIYCGDYLELAARANSIENAEENLSKGIEYLEENNITSGATKIILYKPRNDIGIWYNNLKTAQTELQEMIAEGTVSNTEKSNMLMKLRETLVNESGDLIHPTGIERGNYYQLTFWLNVTLWLTWIVPFMIFVYFTKTSNFKKMGWF